jgi:hypothetical protein
VGVLFDYFRASNDAAVRRHMDENDAFSPVPATFDGIELKTIDPGVILGKLVALVADVEWTPGLVDEHLVWPEGGEHDMDHEGPWVTVLGNRARDILASIPADRVSELAEQWGTAEEFGGYADPEFLREVIPGFVALAVQARTQGESLYCWICL